MELSRIVVGVDDTEGARGTLRWLAQRCAPGDHVVVVHAFRPATDLVKALLPMLDPGDMEEKLHHELETEWCRPLRDAGIEFVTKMKHRGPTESLVEVADEVDADLIVVGSEGDDGPFDGGGIGGTTNKLVHRTHRPVLVVPHPGRAGASAA